MAFGTSKAARIAKLEERIAQLTQVFGRADARLDNYPAALASLFGDTLTDSSAGRWTSRGTVGDVYSIYVDNSPGNESTVFTAIKHGRDISPLVVTLHPGEVVDFDADDLETLEAWVAAARSGQVPDPNRHLVRAEKMFGLVG